jgi:hypothetical protein
MKRGWLTGDELFVEDGRNLLRHKRLARLLKHVSATGSPRQNALGLTGLPSTTNDAGFVAAALNSACKTRQQT